MFRASTPTSETEGAVVRVCTIPVTVCACTCIKVTRVNLIFCCLILCSHATLNRRSRTAPGTWGHLHVHVPIWCTLGDTLYRSRATLHKDRNTQGRGPVPFYPSHTTEVSVFIYLFTFPEEDCFFVSWRDENHRQKFFSHLLNLSPPVFCRHLNTTATTTTTFRWTIEKKVQSVARGIQQRISHRL